MKRLVTLIMGLILLPAIAATTPNSSAGIQKMIQMPLTFTKNNSQWDEQGFPKVEDTIETEATSGGSIGDFLKPDGRFDLEAARRSRYQGPLDLKGFKSTFDPSTGQPVFRPVALASPADHPDDIYWDNSISPSIPGVGGYIKALTVYNGRLIVGGSFAVAGNVIANNIASWDGTSWSPLGSGVCGYVMAFAVYANRLIVGGDFTTAGGAEANHIAAWDGVSWSPLGSGMNSGVYALAVYDTKLIAGGLFTTAGSSNVNRIAAWDGSSWSRLGWGVGLSSAYVWALTVYQGKLIAGGAFSSAGGVSANNIAAWDGSSWSSLGLGTDSYVNALTVYNNRLIAGGWFSTAGSTTANGIAAWNGSSWSPLGSGVDSFVEALAVYGNRLIVGGDFTEAGGTPAECIAAWNGSKWSTMGSGMSGTNYPEIGLEVLSLVVYDNHLIAGGAFKTAGEVFANSVAAWDGSSWSLLGSGMNGVIKALVIFREKLIAAGSFNTTGEVNANNIASWDGSSWSPLGLGIEGYEVRALTVFNDKLIAGGWFWSAGGTTAHNIAIWDGSSWSSPWYIGDYGVYALCVNDNKLIAGGAFGFAGGVVANDIASWDGSSWSPLGLGIEGYEVRALTVFDDKLIAGGRFWSAGAITAHNIASWDGSSWSALSSGMDYYVSALSVYNNQLVAGGGFAMAGGISAKGIASWNGSSWSPIGSETAGECSAFTVYNDKLIAGGVSASKIAAWDGSSWSPLGSGVDDQVMALTVHNHKLIAGGNFTTAGNKVSAYIAAWDDARVPYFVHLTDLHYGDHGARNKVKEIIHSISSWIPKPEFVIITGDILSFGDISGEGPCPLPLWPVWLCPFYDLSENDYSFAAADLQKFLSNGIPYYVCPGNHDYYELLGSSKSLAKYQARFGELAFESVSGNLRLLSVNSGQDAALSICPGASGLSTDTIQWIADHLDALDGNPNNSTDESGFTKVIMMHHPVINFGLPPLPVPCVGWDVGTITTNKPDLMSICSQYAVDLVCTGHTHYARAFRGWMDNVWDFRLGYYHSFPLSTNDGTLFIQTSAATDGSYRKIETFPDRLLVHQEASIKNNVKLILGGGSSWKSRKGDGDSIGCPARLHLYDIAGNHVGVNDTSGIDMEISGTVYSLQPTGIIPESDSLSWEMSIEEISSFLDPAGFTFEIRGSAEGSAFLTIEKITTEGGHESAYYDSVMVTASSVGHLYVLGDSIDYGIRFDDNGDGVVDRVVQPDEINLPDFMCGDANGDISVNIADAVYLISYIFTGGPAPAPLAAGDADCSGDINIADCVYLISYIFSHGLAPCAVCK